MAVAVSSTQPSLQLIPALGTLGPAECEALLKRTVIGRLAFTLHDRVSIVPISYVYDEGWIYGRTEPAGKLVPILRNRRVAFEVDEHQGMFSWQSVVVRGALYLLDPDASEKQKTAHQLALRLLRRLLPSTLGKADPVPFRNQLFRIRASEISGRFAGLGGTSIVTGAARTVDTGADPEGDTALYAGVIGAIAKAIPFAHSRLHVDAFDGIVVLTGVVETEAERILVERAILGVAKVRAVVQQLETVFPPQSHPAPADLARDARRKLGGSFEPPSTDVKVVVEHDWLRAEGTVPTRALRDDAIRRLRDVRGARGIIDRINVSNDSA